MPVSYTVVLSAILRTIAEPVRIDPGEGGMAWYGTPTELVLTNDEGRTFTEGLKALGLSLQSSILRRDWTYHVSGDFGQNPITREAFIKHSEMTQSEICASAPAHQAIAGKATICGTGKVVNVSFDNFNEDEEWHLTVEAEHDLFDPKQKQLIKFEIIYCFGYFTPRVEEAEYIKKGASIFLQGTLVSQDPISKRFIAQVMHHAEVKANVIGNVVWVE
ncbi:uncharacterized protein MELLADRAFT_62897 [Melampsora larici-populina 98AG31]|uniref:Uncharacterized protein n=1 Tax=Melampsora larici-populina (strain 98AG31 / pathotype 3-4-7) TaxID=747676 RepID=F4RKN8_MELLP|nr:uncharacterized protein MELLADRAFT_62897 [Melampsora larici-populina 98AG31]EGG07145.1 hypothetical protein MELLADRAFT_62897 [Melampsora larici-populina 98AG31]